MMKIFKDFLKEEKGQTMVEWIMILAVILVIIMLTMRNIGKQGNKKANEILKNMK